MHFKSIIALTDFSRAAHHAVERAARLAAAGQTRLAVMHIAPEGGGGPADVAGRLGLTVRRLSRRLQKNVRPVPGADLSLDDAVREAASADLLVVGYSAGHPLAALLRGTAMERLARRSACPVLVVKAEPVADYRRVMVAVDFNERSRKLVKLAGMIDGAPHIQLFHAVSTREEAILRSAEASVLSVQAWREEAALHAQGRMISLADSFKARRNRVMTALGRGDAARQVAVQQERGQADLVIIGNSRRLPWARWLSGSVSSRIMHQVASDVMLCA